MEEVGGVMEREGRGDGKGGRGDGKGGRGRVGRRCSDGKRRERV